MVAELTNVTMAQRQAMVVNVTKATTVNIVTKGNMVTMVTKAKLVAMATQLLSS
jgi:hypothetical protein